MRHAPRKKGEGGRTKCGTAPQKVEGGRTKCGTAPPKVERVPAKCGTAPRKGEHNPTRNRKFANANNVSRRFMLPFY